MQTNNYTAKINRKNTEDTYKREEYEMTISNQTFERCIEECLQCTRWCSQCRTESLNEDPIMMRECIRLCNECLELCRTCVLLLTSSSGFARSEERRVGKVCSCRGVQCYS